ncbi:hypothetical protein D1007_00799 [Hordeum vulgare]|nr:hypothetical protein D1007_00799 [Hordeum vulgare]
MDGDRRALAAAAAASVLDDDLLREILLSLGFPNLLVRAALASKRWAPPRLRSGWNMGGKEPQFMGLMTPADGQPRRRGGGQAAAVPVPVRVRTIGEIMLKQVVGNWPDEITARFDLVFAGAPFPAEGKFDVDGIFDLPYYE